MLNDKQKETYSRNFGLISEADQEIISNSVVGIAGTGADGGLTAERIIRLGVKGVKLSDPESFDQSNINRQFGATQYSVGKNKCLTVADELKRIRPELEIETYPEGINESNADKFVKGCDVLLDEIEYTIPKASYELHKAGRKLNLEIFAGLNLAFGINIFRFIPDGPKFEDLIGFSETSGNAEFRMESLVPNIPDYVDKKIVEKVLKRELYVPTISPTIGLLSGFLSYLVLGTIIKKWTIPEAPKFLHADMFNQEYSIRSM